MKKILIIIGLVVSANAFSQIKTNLNIGQNAADGLTPFLDASSTSDWNNSTNVGKGLVFPQVDLSTLETIAGPGRPGSNNAPTRYDGMIVYNIKEGGKPAIGATDSTPELQKGFYYYDNKTNDLQGGHWVRFADIDPNAKTMFWTINGNTGTAEAIINPDTNAITGGNFIGTADDKKVTIGTNSVARLEIGEKNEVTVGDGKFNFVLDVYGKARFRKGIVTAASTYPDYVFDNYFTGKSDINPTYKFKKLDEVEAFIKENNHLPGVTKIDDLAKTENGYEVDNTQLSVQTLEKVEELYLHVIEQQKEIQALKAEIAELKK